jgi:cytochrome c oxidase accessory protein FixG
MAVHLKVYPKASSLRADGSRNFVHPADVTGKFERRRRWLFAALLIWFSALPWIDVGRHPAVFLDIPGRRFYLFGTTWNAQDFWLVFFLLSGLGFALIAVTAIWGRLWCGYACPQTVFLEGVFRPIERLIEGPRTERIRRNAGPMSFDKLWRKVVKHTLFLGLAGLFAHIVSAYFISVPRLYRMVLGAPSQHPEAFLWATVLSGALYFNFFWFREQLCLIVCPYGRLQSLLTDRDTLVIGYDERRGEPRAKKSEKHAGDCVDCMRCVVVCPTGIDIRHGLQIDCIGCARCVDACDDVMHKLGRAPGLIRYDSQKGFQDGRSQLFRPRIQLYAALGALGALVASIAFSQRATFEANLLRLRDVPAFVVEGDHVRNAFEVHLVNKRGATATFELRGVPDPALRYTIAVPVLHLSELSDQRVPVFIDAQLQTARMGVVARLELRIDGQLVSTLPAPLVAPR